MLLETIRAELTKAMKARDEVRKNILRLVIGEAGQTNATADTEIQSIMRKLIERNEEAITFLDESTRATESQFRKEIIVLQDFLPRTLSQHEIKSSLMVVVNQIRECPKEGAAIGIAMKFLKESETQVDGKDVKEVVLKLRQEE